MDTVRLAIIGCGNISQLNARGYLQHPQCERVALCDTVRARADARAQQWGISPRIYTDYAQVLNDAQIDTLELLTPTFLHAEQIIAALQAGKHVSCQKPRGAFYRDGRFVVALLLGVLFWLVLWLTTAVSPLSWQQLVSWRYFFLALWHPCWEEVLFRGVLQGYARQAIWGQWQWRGLTGANLLVSILFMAGHWFSHPPLWATAVFLPSLLFGWMRDRYGSVYPALVLHAFYNAGYFWLTGFPAS
jgi:CAAX protease family protein